MGYMTNGLSFNTLRSANIKRAVTAEKFAKCINWKLGDWERAVGGEWGEYLNLMKKVERGDFTLEQALPNIARELADVQIYLDLLAEYLNINLGQATIDKFNEVSERIGSRVYIGHDDDWHLRPEDFL